MIIFNIIFLIFSNAVTLRQDKSILFARTTILVLLGATFICYNSLDIPLLEKGIGLYGGLFYANSYTHIFNVFIFILSAIILTLNSFYPIKIVFGIFFPDLKDMEISSDPMEKIRIKKTEEQFTILEYPLIIIFIITGAILLMSTNDLVSIFLAIELQSYGLYLLSTIYRNSELATTGGLTYFLLGGLSSCFILLSTGLLYANSGTSNLDNLFIISSISEISDNSISTLNWYSPYYINISLLIMSVGFLFKISAAPFHFWSPDVYDAIPTIVTTFVAIIAKISIFVFLTELVYYTNNIYILSKFNWTFVLLVSSLLSLLIGTVLGLIQSRIKKLFAYSTISHIGFMLLALSICSIESIQAFIFYLMQYSLANLNAFMLLIAVGYSLSYYKKKNKNRENMEEKENSPIQLISQMKGYFYINPILALSLAITLFSFVGVPPLIGFFAKQMLLFSAINTGYIFMSLVAILTSVISAVYYLVVIKQIFFDKPEYESKFIYKERKILGTNVLYDRYHIFINSNLAIIISILTFIILFFIFIPEEWLSMTNIIALVIFNI